MKGTSLWYLTVIKMEPISSIYSLHAWQAEKKGNIKEDLERDLKEAITVKMLLMNSWGESSIKTLRDTFTCYLITLSATT